MKGRKTVDAVQAQIDAALGLSVLCARTNGRWALISEEDAQRLRDAGRGAEVQRVWLKDPDTKAFASLLKQCPLDVQDAVADKVRKMLRADPEFALRTIKHLRRVATDPAAPPKERRAAVRFLRHHGLDDESLVHEE